MTYHEVTGDHGDHSTVNCDIRLLLKALRSWRFQILFVLPLGKKIQFDLLAYFQKGCVAQPPTRQVYMEFSIGFTFGRVFLRVVRHFSHGESHGCQISAIFWWF